MRKIATSLLARRANGGWTMDALPRSRRPSARGVLSAAVIWAALALTSPARAGGIPNCSFCLNGPVTYQFHGNTVDITIAEVDYVSVYGEVPGQLVINLAITDTPFVAGVGSYLNSAWGPPGFGAYFTLPQLPVRPFELHQVPDGPIYSNIDTGPIAFVPPPDDGTYYLVLMLMDGIGAGGEDWENLPNPVTFPIAIATTSTTTAPTTTTTTQPPRIPRKQCLAACMPEIQACRASCVAPGRGKCRMRCRPSVVRLCKTTGYCS
jgi:hypothetical protein